MKAELVMYGRKYGCMDQVIARNFLELHNVPYRFIDIGSDPVAAQRVHAWVGHLSVPTLVVANPGEEVPLEEPAPRDPSRRTRGQDRGSLIVEPSERQLEAFLRNHNLL